MIDETKPRRVQEDGQTKVYLGKVDMKFTTNRKPKPAPKPQSRKVKSLSLKG